MKAVQVKIRVFEVAVLLLLELLFIGITGMWKLDTVVENKRVNKIFETIKNIEEPYCRKPIKYLKVTICTGVRG